MLTSVAGHRCPTCHEPAEITPETRVLPCSHVAFRTDQGAVVGWENSVNNALNLERVLNQWENAGRTPASVRKVAIDTAARYPVADAELPLGEQDRANEKTLAAVMRERASRQAGIVQSQ